MRELTLEEMNHVACGLETTCSGSFSDGTYRCETHVTGSVDAAVHTALVAGALFVGLPVPGDVVKALYTYYTN